MKIFNISPYLNNMVIQVIAILHCHIVYVWSYCVLLESLLWGLPGPSPSDPEPSCGSGASPAPLPRPQSYRVALGPIRPLSQHPTAVTWLWDPPAWPPVQGPRAVAWLWILPGPPPKAPKLLCDLWALPGLPSKPSELLHPSPSESLRDSSPRPSLPKPF